MKRRLFAFASIVGLAFVGCIPSEDSVNDGEFEGFPITIAWKNEPSSTTIVPFHGPESADWLAFHYTINQRSKVGDVECIIQLKTKKEGSDKIETGNISSAESRQLEGKSGIIDDWNKGLLTWLSIQRSLNNTLSGEATMQVALFRARTGDDMPTEQISNWISLPTKFE